MAATTYIKDVNITSNGSTTSYLIEPALYGIASTSDSGSSYTVSMPTGFTLIPGATIQVKFTTTNKVNATLNVSSLGAKSIYYNGAQITASTFKANHIYTLVYDNGSWHLTGDIDTNTQRPIGTGANDAAAGNHGHGNITNDGKMAGSTASGDVTTSHKFLREDGTWVVPSYTVDTWRGIQDNLTSSTNTTESLSAKQGYNLANGSARDSTKLPLAGGTMTGNINRYYSASNTEPMLKLSSNNKNALLFWIGHGTEAGSISGNYYKLKYNGEGTSPNNYLQLIAATSSSAETTAAQWDEYGNATYNGEAHFNLGTSNTSSNYRKFTIQGTDSNKMSIAPTGIQVYNSSNAVTTMYLQGYGGNLIIGASSYATATRDMYGVFDFKSSTGFNYSGIGAGSDNVARNIWFSYNGKRGIPVYDDDFKYNPSTNTITIGTGSLSATTYSGNAANVTGTVTIDHGGTGKTNANDAANALLSGLPTHWTATPLDDTTLIRSATDSATTFGRVKFSTIWNYIKSKADSTYAGINALAVANALVYKGVIAGVATDDNNAYGALTPAANCGDTYKVSTAGFINGLRVEVGDMLICTTDDTAAATDSGDTIYTTIRNNWNIIQTSEGSVSTSSTSSTDNAIARFDGTSGRIIKSNSYTTLDDNGHISITHKAGSSTELQFKYSTTIDYWWGVGTGDQNHGMWDAKAGQWIISAGSSNTWTFVGNVTGNVSGSSGSCTGLAAKATADASGNTITTYYCTLSTAQTLSGAKTFSAALVAQNNVTVGTTTAGSFGIAETDGAGRGISLYGGPKAAGSLEYGIMFAKTATFGKCGSVTSDWATYFTMNRSDTRGWIFKSNAGAANGNNNVASIAGNGNIYTAGTLKVNDTTASTGTTVGAIITGGGIATGAASYLTGSVHIVGTAANNALIVRGISGSGSDGNRDATETSQELYLNYNGGKVQVGFTETTAISTNMLKIAYNSDSSSTSTGALVVDGGVGIAKTLYVGTGIYTANNGNTSTGIATEAALKIREYNYSGSASDSDTWGQAPRLAWIWNGRKSAQIGLASNGYLYEAPNSGTNYYKIVYENGTWAINISKNAASATALKNSGRLTDANITRTTDGGVRFFLATSSMTSNKPSSDGHILHFHWDGNESNAWDSQLFISDGHTGKMQWRGHANATTWGTGWHTILDDSNTTAPTSVPTLSWNTESTIFTLNGTAVKIKAMAKPTYTYSDVGAAPAVNGGYLPLSGGTLTGALTTANNTWNTIGDDAYLGDINKAGHIGIQGKNGNTGIFFTTYNQTTKTTGGAITWDGTKFSITSTTAIDASISGSAAALVVTDISNTSTATDLNNLKDAYKVYFAGGSNTVVNNPAGAGTAFGLTIKRIASGYRLQDLITSGGIRYYRIWNSSAWGEWYKILDSTNTDAGTNNAATLTWSTTYTIAKINGTDIKFTTMTKPTYAFTDLTSHPTTLSGYGITDAATSGHTHTLSIAEDSGTNALTLAYGKKYKLTAGGSTYIFTMPASDNTNTASAVDNILDGSNSGTAITYAPYSAQQAKLSFDTSTTAPSRTDRLNLNGYLYATKLYSGGTEVSISGHTHTGDQILGGYLNTHGENGGTIIPFSHNDLAFVDLRGGSYTAYVTTSTDYTAATLNSTATLNLDSIFNGQPNYANTGRVYSDVIVIDITCHTTFTWTQTFYIDFGAASWRARMIRVLVKQSSDETAYTLKGSTDNNGSGHYVCNVSHRSGTGFNCLRVVLGNWANTSSTDHRIAQVGIYSYSSQGNAGTLMSRGVDNPIWRSISVAVNDTYDIGSSTNKWKNIYATTFNGNLTGNVTGNADTATKLSTNASNTTASFWRGDNTWSDTISGGTLKITNNSNTVTIGSQNTSFTHIYNSANIPFIFNKDVLATESHNLGSASWPWGNLYIGAKGNRSINYVGTKATYAMITFLDNTADANGNGIKIGGGGVTIIGSGEAAGNFSPASAGSEVLYLLSDNQIYLEANGQTIANRVGLCINNSNELIPVKAETATNNYGSIGTSSYNWANIYATTFTGSILKLNNYINSILTGAGTAAVTSGTKMPALWRFDLEIASPTEGDMVTIKIPVAGHGNGVFVSLDNGTTYYPVSVSGTVALTTHYAKDQIITLVCVGGGGTNSIYPAQTTLNSNSYTLGTAANITGKHWCVVNYYDSGNTNTATRQKVRSTDANYSLLFADPVVGTADNNTNYYTYRNDSIYVNPSTGNVYATAFNGSGASLTSLNASNLSSGTIGNARLPARLQEYHTSASNDTTASGWYYGTSDSPFSKYHTSNTDFMVWTHGYSTTWASEIGTDFRSNRLAVRNKNNGTWNSWRELAGNDDIVNEFSWTSDVNYDSVTNTFTNTRASNSWASQVYSKHGFSDGCYVSWKTVDATHHMMIGLNSDPTTNANWTGLDYAWYMQNNGAMDIRESNSTKTPLTGHTTYAAGDDFRIEYNNGQIRYYHNGVCCRTVERAISGQLYLDSSLYNGGTITDLRFGPITNIGTISIAHGGTGATSAADARTNLGLGTAATYNIVGTGNTNGYSSTETLIPRILKDGVMEVGKYIDFHASAGDSKDYDVRITAATTGLTISGTTSGTFSGSLTGNATTCSYPAGFNARNTNATWGNQAGTTVTCWGEANGGSIDFRCNNPSSGKLSIKVDGRFYGNEGTYPTMLMRNENNYWGLCDPDATNNVWIRTTTLGIIPYQSGGEGDGHCGLGTSSWYFSNAYVDTAYNTKVIIKNKVTLQWNDTDQSLDFVFA